MCRLSRDKIVIRCARVGKIMVCVRRLLSLLCALPCSKFEFGRGLALGSSACSTRAASSGKYKTHNGDRVIGSHAWLT